jgi:hypothetical protein
VKILFLWVLSARWPIGYDGFSWGYFFNLK